MSGSNPPHQHRLIPANSKQPAARALPLQEQLFRRNSCRNFFRFHLAGFKLRQKLQSLSKHNLNDLRGLVPISKHSNKERFQIRPVLPIKSLDGPHVNRCVVAPRASRSFRAARRFCHRRNRFPC